MSFWNETSERIGAYRNVQWNGEANGVQRFAISTYMLCAGVRTVSLISVQKNWELRQHIDKLSSQSSYVTYRDASVNQESVKMLYSRYDWTKLVIIYSSCSINHSKRSLALNHTIMPNVQHAKVKDTLRLPSSPSGFFYEWASQT